MARRKKGMVVEDDEPELDISSLIDVCFLLLIYFIVTSQIVPQEKDLPMTIPSQQPSDEKPDIEPMLISVLAAGNITVNKSEPMDTSASGKERALPLLSARLNEYSSMAQSSGSTPVIQIFASPECPQQQVIDVLNSVRGANINTVTFTDSGE